MQFVKAKRKNYYELKKIYLIIKGERNTVKRELTDNCYLSVENCVFPKKVGKDLQKVFPRGEKIRKLSLPGR